MRLVAAGRPACRSASARHARQCSTRCTGAPHRACIQRTPTGPQRCQSCTFLCVPVVAAAARVSRGVGMRATSHAPAAVTRSRGRRTILRTRIRRPTSEQRVGAAPHGAAAGARTQNGRFFEWPHWHSETTVVSADLTSCGANAVPWASLNAACDPSQNLLAGVHRARECSVGTPPASAAYGCTDGKFLLWPHMQAQTLFPGSSVTFFDPSAGGCSGARDLVVLVMHAHGVPSALQVGMAAVRGSGTTRARTSQRQQRVRVPSAQAAVACDVDADTTRRASCTGRIARPIEPGPHGRACRARRYAPPTPIGLHQDGRRGRGDAATRVRAAPDPPNGPSPSPSPAHLPPSLALFLLLLWILPP